MLSYIPARAHHLPPPHSRTAAAALLLALAPLATAAAQTTPTPPQVFYACYVPLVGTVYRIKASGLPDNCFGPTSGPMVHVQFSWTDGLGALHTGDAAGGDLTGTYPNPGVGKLLGVALGTTAPTNGQVLSYNGTNWVATTPPAGVTAHSQLTGLLNDDHPQYLLTNGTRALTGAMSMGGFKLTGLAAATTAGDAVPFQQAVKSGDAAGGDLAGTYPNPGVGKLAGVPLSSTAPASGQVLTFNGSGWAPATPTTGVTAHSQLTGLLNDDHPQYLLTQGVRNSPNGFAVTGTNGTGTIPTTGQGTRLMWYPGKSAFRAGFVFGSEWDDQNIGDYSAAFGAGSRAIGRASFAAGEGTYASGEGSTALGANGTSAIAKASTALGWASMADGDYSFAAGYFASTNGHSGSFVFADATLQVSSFGPSADNQFIVRASGGFRFRTATDLSTGCDLPAGSGVFSCTSSRDLKTDFIPVDDDALLAGIAAVPVTSWRYKTEAQPVRHLGPMAQDFRAAFGLGVNETSIGLLDISGVTFAGVQALEKRTAELRAAVDELQALRAEVVALRERAAAAEATNAGLARRLNALEAAIHALQPGQVKGVEP